ncbi:MAG: type II secretion system major pseudopilin GspG, partial [Pseudomonadota bacterium]
MNAKRVLSHRSRMSKGMSILEMMVVLGILALIIGIAAPRAIDYFGRAKSQTAEIQMKQLKGALQLLYVDTGRYPTDAEGLEVLIRDPGTMPRWRGPHLTAPEAWLDPWARTYRYQAGSGSAGFEVFSLGRDG